MGISALYFLRTSGEVKTLTKTEYKEVPAKTDSIQNHSTDVPSFPEYKQVDSIHEDDDVGKYDSLSDESSEELTQMERYERSMASEHEPAATEDAHPESTVEAPAEEPSEK